MFLKKKRYFLAKNSKFAENKDGLTNQVLRPIKTYIIRCCKNVIITKKFLLQYVLILLELFNGGFLENYSYEKRYTSTI